MIWPAIDLMDGRAVRLLKGDFDKQSIYDDDPVDRACVFADAGAKALHVVDLEGAKAAAPRQSALIGQIARQSGLIVQAGGGVRSRDDVDMLLNDGVRRVIIGSLAVTDPMRVLRWLDEFGADVLVLALDVRLDGDIPRPAIKGWQEQTDKSLWDILDIYGTQARHILVTDIDRDGVLGGINAALTRAITTRYPGLALLASGGIGALGDIAAARDAGAAGVIIGKALYEQKFTLNEALSCWQNA